MAAGILTGNEAYLRLTYAAQAQADDLGRLQAAARDLARARRTVTWSPVADAPDR